jgi:hypothetical protein
MEIVRQFGVDYIYFDLIFSIIFIYMLIRFKKKIPLLAYFIGGIGINFIIDYGIWLNTGIREASLPFNFTGSLFLFFLWFSLTYGVQYSYVFLMFEKKTNKIFWTSLVFIGWILVALLSQIISINDSQIYLVRHMGESRLITIIIFLLGYSLLFILRYDWKKIIYLFFIGFLIHFMMEFSLFISGIRPGSLSVLFFNSFIEFNMGIPFFYIFYDRYLRKRFKVDPKR